MHHQGKDKSNKNQIKNKMASDSLSLFVFFADSTNTNKF